MSTSGTLIQKNGPVKIKGFLIGQEVQEAQYDTLIFLPDNARSHMRISGMDWRFEPDGPPPNTLEPGTILLNLRSPNYRYLLIRDWQKEPDHRVPTHWVDLRNNIMGELTLADRKMFADPTKYRKEG